MSGQRSLPISDVFQIKIVCDDCGRRTVRSQHDVARDQVARGLATPEEVCSLYTCDHCKSLGSSGKNLSVRIIARSGTTTEVKRDLRPVSSLLEVRAECLQCGHAARLPREQIASYPASITVHDLWLRAVCGACKQEGSRSVRMAIEVFPPALAASRPEKKVEWSKAKVFSEDRSDPNPNLPRRRLAQA